MTAARPAVSVVVPAYNAAPYLAETLDSALAQTFPAYEVVVVNDGSTDASGEIAHRYAERHPDRIRVIDQPNGGLPAARNAAIAAARGDYLALLDADDVWLPEHLQRAMDAFDHDPDLGLVHANIERMDAHGRSLGVAHRLWRPGTDAFTAIALRHEHVACPTAVFQRECIDSVGAFDRQFTGLGCEDRDLWLRIAERFRVRYLDVVTARYRVHPASMSANRERMVAARRRLLAKLSLSLRGAALTGHIECMIESDLGLELQGDGAYADALRAQLRALRCRPQTLVVWKRLLRLAWTAVAVPGARPQHGRT